LKSRYIRKLIEKFEPNPNLKSREELARYCQNSTVNTLLKYYKSLKKNKKSIPDLEDTLVYGIFEYIS